MNDGELFRKALLNAVYWQNRCCELSEIIEMFCIDAEHHIKTQAELKQPGTCILSVNLGGPHLAAYPS